MIYVSIDGYGLFHKETWSAIMATVALNSVRKDALIEIREGLHKDNPVYCIAGNVLNAIGEKLGNGDTCTVQILGEAVDIEAAEDCRHFFRIFNTERLVLRSDGSIVSLATEPRTAIRTRY